MATELTEACRRLGEGLGPLERQVREVFHWMVGNHMEMLWCFKLRPATAFNLYFW